MRAKRVAHRLGARHHRPHSPPRPHAEIVHLQQPEHGDSRAQHDEDPVGAVGLPAQAPGEQRDTRDEDDHHGRRERELDFPCRSVRRPRNAEPLQKAAPHGVLRGDIGEVAPLGHVRCDFREVAAVAGEEDRNVEQQKRYDAGCEAACARNDQRAPKLQHFGRERAGRRKAANGRMQQYEQQHQAAEEPRGLETGEEQRRIQQSGGGAIDGAVALGSPARKDEIAQAGQQHRRIGLDVDELHGIHIGKREQDGADRSICRRYAECRTARRRKPKNPIAAAPP